MASNPRGEQSYSPIGQVVATLPSSSGIVNFSRCPEILKNLQQEENRLSGTGTESPDTGKHEIQRLFSVLLLSLHQPDLLLQSRSRQPDQVNTFFKYSEFRIEKICHKSRL